MMPQTGTWLCFVKKLKCIQLVFYVLFWEKTEIRRTATHPPLINREPMLAGGPVQNETEDYGTDIIFSSKNLS